VISVEAIWDVFSTASDRLAHPLRPQDLEQLVRYAWFLADLWTDEPLGELEVGCGEPNNEHAIRLAAETRSRFGQDDVSPLLALPQLLDSAMGIVVIPICHPAISGAAALIGKRPIIYVSQADALNTLYMCARQLGHLFRLRGTTNHEMTAVVELAHETAHAPLGSHKRFADYFALELLVPPRGLGIALQEVRSLLKVKNPSIGDIELLYVARIFGVSFLALARRCERAKLLPKGGANVLNSILIEKYGVPEHRADALGLPARPLVSVPLLPGTVVRRIRKLVHRTPGFLQEAALRLAIAEADLQRLIAARP
jgi:Zn-dependent peptidase ImmA (M78 family)